MYHPITDRTMRVTLSQPVDYLSTGITYLATPGVRDASWIRFDREDGSAGTSIRSWDWDRAVKAGILHATPAKEA